MIVVNPSPVMTPAQVDDPDAPVSAADADAVRRMDASLTGQFLDPALRGEYPPEFLAAIEPLTGFDHIHDGDLATINQPIDLLGVNYYDPTVVVAEPGAAAEGSLPGTDGIGYIDLDVPTTTMGWPILPQCLTRRLVQLSREYPEVGLIVTENGAAFDDVVTEGRVHDHERLAYLDGHIRAVHAALEAGADVRGYLAWTLMDNFEWAEGFRHRFGLVHVDYTTQTRTLKDSALWYRDQIHHNALGELHG